VSDAPSRPTRLAGWGRTSESTAEVHAVGDVDALCRLVAAASSGGSVLARGLGRSYGDAAQNGGGVVVSRWRSEAAISLDAGSRTATLTAGTSVSRALRELLPRGWMLPVVPGTRFITVGGAVAADVHGKNHHADGSFGHWIRRLTLVDGCGEVRMLSPGDAPEAFWATVGGLGLTGIILDVVVELVPVTTAYLRVRTRRLGTLDAAFDEMERSAARHHVAWVDGLPGRGFGRVVLDEGDAADVDDLPARLRALPLRYRPHQRLAAPRLPVNAVQRPLVSVFNEMWWRKAPRDRTGIVATDAFFHPLDVVRGWNRLYGPRGFVQWQCCVPLDARDVVVASLRGLADAGVPPSLVVLKRFGAATPGPLSFPMPGWTLAADIPAGDDRLRSVLDRLDAEVCDAGGRVYLVKDSRASATNVRRMYPQLDQWKATRHRLDPRGVFSSDLARRLELV
jgi:decaprenylphospho-beta-D-ribofuranose 2-oxidase